jgi:dTDP-4-dehydrorhamnose 3,5-epimerase-like enzyme
MLARYVDFEVRGDEFGWLVALEGGKNIPFAIKRAYYIFGTKAGVRRGKHAHRKLRQVIVCITGQCKMLLDDGRAKEEVHLTRNDQGLVLDPMVWHEMYDFSADCVLLVLADAWYEEADYIRSYGAFKAACAPAEGSDASSP